MINYEICGVHQIKMQQHKKKIKQHFSPVCVFKKKEFNEKISMNNYSFKTSIF